MTAFVSGSPADKVFISLLVYRTPPWSQLQHVCVCVCVSGRDNPDFMQGCDMTLYDFLKLPPHTQCLHAFSV